jgi:hypothetical protein
MMMYSEKSEKAKENINHLTREMQLNMESASLLGNQQKVMGANYEGLTRIMAEQKTHVAALKETYDQSFVNGKATEATKELSLMLKEAQNELIRTAGKTAELQVKSQGFTGAINKASDSLIKNGQTMENYGGKLTKGITLPLVSGAAAVTTAAVSWESAFAGVKKTVDEVVDSNGRVTYSYKDLENGLRGLSKELPSSHKEIAAVAEAAGQLGIETPNVVSFTKTMIDLGESTSMSAETAATELARFANITGMSQDKFSNLGSALVDLGNNFATTEGEISAMSLRLAGAGSQIGMTEGEILGFAAALSSVGVEAEAGGSAFSKVMIQMQLAAEKGMGAFDELINLGNQSGVSFDQMSYAVQKGGNTLKATAGQMGLTNKQLSSMYKEADKSAISLQNFAEVASMTNAEFGNLFKQDPSKAIMKFVDGLANAESQGKSAIAVLDDMDITEVRLRDSLLRAANASGVFSDAVKMGNSAFKENTALAEEAGKRYETTESKLKMLKNEAVDAAIDLGGPFVDALRDGLESSKPLIKGLGDLATKFSELDPKTQRMIVGLVGGAAAAGPLLSITGKLSQNIGGLGKAFVDLKAKSVKKKAIAELSEQLVKGTVNAETLATVLGGGATKLSLFGKSATVAAGTAGTGGVAGLGTSLVALAGPATIAVASIAAVGTALYLGKKAYDNHQLAGAKWGTEVTKEQDKVIEKSYELREKATSYINEYADGVKTSADKAIQANQDIVESIQKTIDKEYERQTKNAEKLKDGPIKDSLKQQAENDKKYGEQLVHQAQDRVNKINTILSNASKNTRDISDQERQYIEANYKQLSAKQLELAGFTKGEIIAIESAYQKDLTKFSYKELETRANNVSKALNKEQESYKKSQEAILEGTEKGTQRQISLLKELDTEHKNSTESMVLGLAKLRLEQGHSIESMATVWEQYGWTVDEVNALVNSSIEKTGTNLDMFAKGMSEADIAWNELAFDPKTGEVKTNMADTLVEIAQTENGWNQLEFLAKNADLTTNAKEEIAIAMGEVDKWQFLSLEDKRLLLNNDEAKIKLFDTINELGMWNAFNADRKLLGVENADAIYKMMESADKLNQWNSLPPELKTLLADNPAKLTVEQTKQALDIYNALPEDLKILLANNTNAVNNVSAAQRKIIDYNEQKIGAKHLHATANYGEVEAAKNAIAQVYSKNVVIDVEYRGRRTGHTAIPTFRGTNYHPGGDMIVNDQKGSLYEEIVKFPGKAAFIPKGRDVYIPNAPIGTKVIKASDTKRIMNRMGVPRYAQGVGVPKNSTLVKDLERVNSNHGKQTIVNQNLIDLTELNSRVDSILNYLEQILQKSSVIMMDKKLVGVEIADIVYAENQKTNRTKNIIMKGRSK